MQISTKQLIQTIYVLQNTFVFGNYTTQHLCDKMCRTPKINNSERNNIHPTFSTCNQQPFIAPEDSHMFSCPQPSCKIKYRLPNHSFILIHNWVLVNRESHRHKIIINVEVLIVNAFPFWRQCRCLAKAAHCFLQFWQRNFLFPIIFFRIVSKMSSFCLNCCHCQLHSLV